MPHSVFFKPHPIGWRDELIYPHPLCAHLTSSWLKGKALGRWKKLPAGRNVGAAGPLHSFGGPSCFPSRQLERPSPAFHWAGFEGTWKVPRPTLRLTWGTWSSTCVCGVWVLGECVGDLGVGCCSKCLSTFGWWGRGARRRRRRRWTRSPGTNRSTRHHWSQLCTRLGKEVSSLLDPPSCGQCFPPLLFLHRVVPLHCTSVWIWWSFVSVCLQKVVQKTN